MRPKSINLPTLNFIKETVAVDLRLDGFVWVPPMPGIENKNICCYPFIEIPVQLVKPDSTSDIT